MLRKAVTFAPRHFEDELSHALSSSATTASVPHSDYSDDDAAIHTLEWHEAYLASHGREQTPYNSPNHSPFTSFGLSDDVDGLDSEEGEDPEVAEITTALINTTASFQDLSQTGITRPLTTSNFTFFTQAVPSLGLSDPASNNALNVKANKRKEAEDLEEGPVQHSRKRKTRQ